MQVPTVPVRWYRAREVSRRTVVAPMSRVRHIPTHARRSPVPVFGAQHGMAVFKCFATKAFGVLSRLPPYDGARYARSRPIHSIRVPTVYGHSPPAPESVMNRPRVEFTLFRLCVTLSRVVALTARRLRLPACARHVFAPFYRDGYR